MLRDKGCPYITRVRSGGSVHDVSTYVDSTLEKGDSWSVVRKLDMMYYEARAG